MTNRYVGRDFWILQIVLQPSALYRLTRIPTYELTNRFIDAEAIWGKEIRAAHERMCNTQDPEEVIGIAEGFLERIARRSKQELHRVDRVSAIILNQTHPLSIDKLSDISCLSARQFYRKFNEKKGIGPKLFHRVVRFEKAFFMKNANPNFDWLSIALACGYYDYQHLAKDYKFFTNLTPTEFYEVDSKAPERSFGVVELLADGPIKD